MAEIEVELERLQLASAANTMDMIATCDEEGYSAACRTHLTQAQAYEDWATGWQDSIGISGADPRSYYFDVSAEVIADVDYGGNLDALVIDAFSGVVTDADAVAAAQEITDRAVLYDGRMNLTVGVGSVALAGTGCFFTGGVGCAVIVGGAALAEGNNIYDGAATIITGEATDGLIQQAFEAGGMSPKDARQYEQWVELGLAVATVSVDGVLVVTSRSGTLLASADDVGDALAASRGVDVPAGAIENTGLTGDGQSFAGHGGIFTNSDGSLPTVTVPDGTYVTVPVGPNRGLSDTAGQIIESGDVTAGMLFQNKLNNNTTGAITYLPGSEMPNYILTSPDALPPINVLPNSMTVNQGTPLSEIIQPNMGCVNWAACTNVNPGSPSSGSGGYEP